MYVCVCVRRREEEEVHTRLLIHSSTTAGGKPLTCWLSWYDGGGTLWVAIIVTAGAGDTCCIMG